MLAAKPCLFFACRHCKDASLSLTCVAAPTQVKWITFHSGYDFGYLLKVLTCQPLPKTEADFFELLKVSHWLSLPMSNCIVHKAVP